MKLRICCAALASLILAASAQAATPANTLVIAQSIDDAISFNPAQGFELTTVQSFNSAVPAPAAIEPAKSGGAAADPGQRVTGRQQRPQSDLYSATGRQICQRLSAAP